MENDHRSCPDDDDETLIRRFREDPQGPAGRAAAGELIARWQERVYLWSYRILREREAAVDAAQEAFTRMLVALPRYEGRGRFSAWLFTIVHNYCVGRVRTRALMRDEEFDVEWLETDAPGPERTYETARFESEVMEAMQRALEPHERMALWLRAFEGMGVEDITRMMELGGVSGARSVLQVARRKLRAALRAGRRGNGGTT